MKDISRAILSVVPSQKTIQFSENVSVAGQSDVKTKTSSKTISKVKGNFMKDLGKKFMNDPLSRIELTEGI